nr:RecName: Full=Coagulation factor X inhibitor [Deinagkistrodon acutus]
ATPFGGSSYEGH